MLPDLFRQAAFARDRPLERDDQWNLEVVEQAHEVAGVRLQLATQAFVDLGQEVLLDVDERPEAAITDDASWHGQNAASRRVSSSETHARRRARRQSTSAVIAA